MKVIIAGGRDFNNGYSVMDAVKKYENNFGAITEIVCGIEVGADMMGLNYANIWNIPVAKFPANCGKFGKSAGPIRNAEMADYADGLIAFWDGKSKGTANMINVAKAAGINNIIIVNY